MLAQNLDPGSTVEVEKAPDDDEREVVITIAKPARKRETVGVGAKGGDEEAGPELESGDSGEGHLPEPEVLPDVPDAPPAPETEGEGDGKG